MNSSRDPVGGQPPAPSRPHSFHSIPGPAAALLLPSWPAALLPCCPPLAGIDRLQSWTGLTHLPGTSDRGWEGARGLKGQHARAWQAVTTQTGGEGLRMSRGTGRQGQPDQYRPSPRSSPPGLDPKLKSKSTSSSTSTSPTREGPRPKPQKTRL